MGAERCFWRAANARFAAQARPRLKVGGGIMAAEAFRGCLFCGGGFFFLSLLLGLGGEKPGRRERRRALADMGPRDERLGPRALGANYLTALVLGVLDAIAAPWCVPFPTAPLGLRLSRSISGERVSFAQESIHARDRPLLLSCTCHIHPIINRISKGGFGPKR